MLLIQSLQRQQHQKAKWLLRKPKQYRKTNKALGLFDKWCWQEFNVALYDYELDIAWWLLAALIIESIDVFVKMARQSGKTETVTLLIRYLIIFYRLMMGGTALMAAFASPKGEQAKTDTDRVKKSITQLRASWQVEDRELNAKTIRAYRFDDLYAEIYTFSLSVGTQNESKTLNLLIVEESHKANHTKRSDECDPMLSSTGGPTFHFGVGCPVLSDFKRGCDGELPESISLIIPVDRVIADRRKMYEKTGDVKHLVYEKTVTREIRKKGRQNPEIRRNYYLEDTVEEGNFVGRERLLACGRGKDVRAPTGKLFLGIDWGRVSDATWAVVGNDRNDVVDWLKLPSIAYEEQIELLKAWLGEKRMDENGKEFTYLDRILATRGDSTGQGDMPMETLERQTRLPVDTSSHVKFTLQSKNEMYLLFEEALFRDPDDPMRFSYPADHPLASEFEQQMTALVREYRGDGEYLAVHHPDDDPSAKDDAPDATALMLLAAKSGDIGELLIA